MERGGRVNGLAEVGHLAAYLPPCTCDLKLQRVSLADMTEIIDFDHCVHS